MQAFKFRFQKIKQLLAQQLHWQEHRLQTIAHAQHQLQRRLGDAEAEMRSMEFAQHDSPLAMTSLLDAATSGYRDKILTLCQTTRTQIAELEKQKALVRRHLEALRQRDEQLRQLRQQDWDQWHEQRQRDETRDRLEAILRDYDQPISHHGAELENM